MTFGTGLNEPPTLSPQSRGEAIFNGGMEFPLILLQDTKILVYFKISRK